MKRFLCALSFCIFYTLILTRVENTFADNSKHMVNEGGAFLLKPAYTYQYVTKIGDNVAEEGDSYSIQMWQLTGHYKYQAKQQLYGYFKADYALGKKETSTRTHANYNWGAEFGLGWTWGILGSGMISPFASLGYNVFMDKGDTNNYNETSINSRKIKFFGYYGMAGLDIQYLFENNFAIGFLIGIGMYLNPKTSFQWFYQSGENNVNKPREKFNAKRRPFYKGAFNITYHWKTWRFGLDFEYNYREIRNESPKYKNNNLRLDYNIHRCVAAIVIGCPF